MPKRQEIACETMNLVTVALMQYKKITACLHGVMINQGTGYKYNYYKSWPN